MSTNLGYAGKLLTNAAGRVLSFGGTVTPPVLLPTPNPPVITNENDAAQTITFTAPVPVDQVRYEVAGAGPYTPTSFTIQLSPTTSYLPGAVVLYVVAVEGVRNESQRVANLTTLAAYVPPASTTPAAPTLSADDTADTLTVSSAYALAELEQRITDAGAVTALPALVTQVGNVARAEGYYQVRVKAATGRNASAWARSAPFTVAAIPPPTTTRTVFEAEGPGWQFIFPEYTGADGGPLYRNGSGMYGILTSVFWRVETFRYVELYAPVGGSNLTVVVLRVKNSQGAILASGRYELANPPHKAGGETRNVPEIMLDMGTTGNYRIEVLSEGGTYVFDAIEIY